MKFLERQSDTDYFIKLNIKTSSKSQKIVSVGDFLTIFLKSKPIQNRANKELISLIKKKLNLSSDQIRIISGLRRPDKIIKLNLSENIDEQEIIKRLIT